jgi:copper chaperone CopZ
MSLEIVAGLLGSGLVRAVASEVATTLACQAISAAVGSMARPLTVAQDSNETLAMRSAAPTQTERTAPAAPADAALTLQRVPNVEILSAIPGRARLRVQGLREDAARATEVSALVRALDGVTVVEANPLTGTLLVRFDASQTDVTTIVAALEPPVRTRPLRAAERAPYLRLVVG